MMDELVSVIITTYKRNDLLPRAINSVLNQSYQNIEVIVVDDNNSDSEWRRDTEELIKEKYGKEDRLHYIKMPMNSGACAARNEGVRHANGQYINFLDDDDEFCQTKIEKQVELFRHQPELGVVGCFAEIIDENGNVKGYEQSKVSGDVFFQQLCQNITTTSLSLIRKKLYVQSGGFEQMHSSQEHWMFAKIYAINPNYDFVAETLVRLYHHSGERISTNRNKPLGAIELAEKVKVYYPALTINQKETLDGFMSENIIYAYLNCGDKKHANQYLKRYLQCGAVSTEKKLKVGVMCIIGIANYRKILRIIRK